VQRVPEVEVEVTVFAFSVRVSLKFGRASEFMGEEFEVEETVEERR